MMRAEAKAPKSEARVPDVGLEPRSEKGPAVAGHPTRQPKVVALCGSPRRQGNTAFALGIAIDELRRRGVASETIMLADSVVSPGVAGPRERQRDPEEETEELLDAVWGADGLILATPVYFCNVSAQMKAFMDLTNDRFLSRQWLAPRVVGLLVIGGQGGMTETVEALRRYLGLVAPSHPPIEVATGRAEAAGEAERSREVRAAAVAMAARMAAALLG